MQEKNENKDKSLLTLKNIRDVLLICLIIVITWKLINSNINVSIKEFSFTDLLSVFVSFFAIALSVAFYFKATETSNRFYDNSYSFTKEISEILGRIEAGFGEKLKHIDEGYAGIRDRFDQFPFDANKAKEDIEAEKEEIEKKEKEQNDLLEDLAKKAKLAVAEKEQLFRTMEKTHQELDLAKSDLRRMQRNMIKHENDNAVPSLKRRAMDYLIDKIHNEIPQDPKRPVTMKLIRDIFDNIRKELHHEAIDDLQTIGVLDNNEEFTRKGIEEVRFILTKRR